MKTKTFIYGYAGSGKTTALVHAINNTQGVFVAFADVDGSTRFAGYETPHLRTLKELQSDKWQVVVIDSITVLYNEAERKYCREKNILTVDEIPYGKGHKEVSARVLNFLNSIDTEHLILVGHCKSEYIETDFKTHKVKNIFLNKNIADNIIVEYDTVAYFRAGNLHFSKKAGQYCKSRVVMQEQSCTLEHYIKKLLSL